MVIGEFMQKESNLFQQNLKLFNEMEFSGTSDEFVDSTDLRGIPSVDSKEPEFLDSDESHSLISAESSVMKDVMYIDSLGMIFPKSSKIGDKYHFNEVTHIVKNLDGSLKKVRVQPYFSLYSSDDGQEHFHIGEREIDIYLTLINICKDQMTNPDEFTLQCRQTYPEIAHLNPFFFSIRDVCDKLGLTYRNWYTAVKSGLESLHRLEADVTYKVMDSSGDTKQTTIKMRYLLHYKSLETRGNTKIRGLYYGAIDQTYANNLTKTSLANIQPTAYLQQKLGMNRSLTKHLVSLREIHGPFYSVDQSELASSIGVKGTTTNQRKYIKRALDGLVETGVIRYEDKKEGDCWKYYISHTSRSANDTAKATFMEMAITVYGEEILNGFGITSEKYEFLKDRFGHNELGEDAKCCLDFRGRKIDRFDYTIDVFVYQMNQKPQKFTNQNAYIKSLYDATSEKNKLVVPNGYVETIEDRYKTYVERAMEAQLRMKTEKKNREEREANLKIDMLSLKLWNAMMEGKLLGNIDNVRFYFYQNWFLKEFEKEKNSKLVFKFTILAMNSNSLRMITKEEISQIRAEINDIKMTLWEKLNSELQEMTRQAMHQGVPLTEILKETGKNKLSEEFFFSDKDGEIVVPEDFASNFYLEKGEGSGVVVVTPEVLKNDDDDILSPEDMVSLTKLTKKKKPESSTLTFSL